MQAGGTEEKNDRRRYLELVSKKPSRSAEKKKVRFVSKLFNFRGPISLFRGGFKRDRCGQKKDKKSIFPYGVEIESRGLQDEERAQNKRKLQ